MLERLNEELAEVKRRQLDKRRWEERLKRTEAGLRLEQVKLQSLKKQMDKEQKDVDRLTSLSVAGMVYLLTGRNPARMDKEKREALVARLKYEEAVKTSKDMESELDKIQSRLDGVRDADQKYQALIRKKEELIKDRHSPLSEALYAMVDREAALRIGIREYEEALEAGERARISLEEAMQSLSRTKKLSTMDMLGGGALATIMKRQEMGHSHDEIHEAQRDLRLFEDELHDIRIMNALPLEESGLLTFADYFFDGFVVDWFVHEQIRESEEKTRQTLKQTRKIIRNLRRQLTSLRKKLEDAVQQRLKWVEKTE